MARFRDEQIPWDSQPQEWAGISAVGSAAAVVLINPGVGSDNLVTRATLYAASGANLAPGLVGRGILYTSTAAYLRHNVSIPSNTAPWTIFGVFENRQGVNAASIAAIGSGGANPFVRLMTYNNGSIQVRTSAATVIAATGSAVALNTPVAYAIAYSGSDIKVFVSGNLEGGYTGVIPDTAKSRVQVGEGYWGQSALGLHYLYGFTQEALDDETLIALTSTPASAFAAIFEPQSIPVYVAGAGGAPLPTLSLPTYLPGSLTSTGFRPRVTAS